MADLKTLVSASLLEPNFSIHEVDIRFKNVGTLPILNLAPTLGPLAAFHGTFTGKGFNTIFRPDSAATPTKFPVPPVTTDPADNVLELNLTDETLSFSNSLGSIPNRGSGAQADAFLNGVPYLQTVNDINDPSKIVGIHFEPGIWLAVPATTQPNDPFTVTRMASIPHGTTIVAQGVGLPPIAGKPTISPVDITPLLGGIKGTKFTFQNQTVANKTTRRIPQDLTGLPAITQALLNDPNTLLRNQIQNQTIAQTIVIEISTKPGSPLPGGPLPAGAHPSAPNFAGGASNIAFLPAVPTPTPGGAGSNANVPQVDAVFWIETVVYDVQVPAMSTGTPPLTLQPVQQGSVPLVPSFVASLPNIPGKKFAGGTVKVPTTQIQYSQKVVLDFAGLAWPHVSVASLIPNAPIPIPQNLLPLT